ncbi:MAG: adenosylcobinamide-phosphate synthase CbiB [Acidimicrobiales bacterium]
MVAAWRRRPGAFGIAAGLSTQSVLGILLAVAADAAFGDPPDLAHPVAAFGRAMTRLEGRVWADSKLSGVSYCAAGVGAGAGVGLVAAAVGNSVGAKGRVAAAAAAGFTAIGSRSLREAASGVACALNAGDLALARRRVRSLVGRNPETLGSAEIARAAVESVAENTVDAVIAPMLWGLVAGAPGVLAYRAVNTMDAMVGHHSSRYERFGWASARLDDAANWLPARLAASLVCICSPSKTRQIFQAVRTQAPAHPSPNAGVAEASFAAALGIRLGGVNVYSGRVESRPPLGRGRPAEPGDIEAACRLSQRVVLAACGALAGAWALSGSRALRMLRGVSRMPAGR